MSKQYAFPIREKHYRADHPDFHGLTKREYFAGLAMQGLLSNAVWLDTAIGRIGNTHRSEEDVVSSVAKAMADALLSTLAASDREGV